MISDLSYWQKCGLHWIIVLFLMWIGYENPDATFLILFIGWGTWLYIFKDGFN